MSVAIGHALKGALRPAPAPTRPEPALLLGAGGWLGAAMLAQLLARPQSRVGAWVERPHQWRGSTHRHVHGLSREALLAGAPEWQQACAYIVLEQGGPSARRDAVFGVPQAAQLLELAQQLRAAGVARLVVVQPHLPGSLPEALRHGFADGVEQGLAALGFAQMLLVRSSRDALALPASASWLERLAAAWWAQLRYMLPSAERPLRSVALARVVVVAAQLLREAPGSVFILTQELASRAAQQPQGIEAVLRQHWLGDAPASG